MEKLRDDDFYDTNQLQNGFVNFEEYAEIEKNLRLARMEFDVSYPSLTHSNL